MLAAKAEVNYDSRIVKPADIAQAITDLGFPATIIDETDGNKTQVEIKVFIYLFKVRKIKNDIYQICVCVCKGRNLYLYMKSISRKRQNNDN